MMVLLYDKYNTPVTSVTSSEVRPISISISINMKLVTACRL